MTIDNYFEDKGSGAPIVFIHGSYATTSTWKKMIGQLSENNRCISIKLPGHGGAPDLVNCSDPVIETELGILAQVVNLLTAEPIHLVGHSVGGAIALAQALKGNLNLGQVTLFEPTATWVLERAGDQMMSARVEDFLTQFRQDVSTQKPYACAQVIDFWGGKGAFKALPDFIKANMELLTQNNIRHWDITSVSHSQLTDLKHCTVPMRLVYGNQSNPVARSICEHLSRYIPNSKQYEIEGASHFLVTSHPHECVQVMSEQ